MHVHLPGLLTFALVLRLGAAASIPKESAPSDRVGDGASVLIDDGQAPDHAHNTSAATSQAGGLIFPDAETSTSRSDKYAANIAQSGGPVLGFPRQTQEAHSSALAFPPKDEDDDVNASPTDATSPPPPLVYPNVSSALPVELDEPEPTSSPAPNVTTTMRPLREPESLLIPTTDATGKPLCLSSPSDTFCEAVKDYPKGDLKRDIQLSPLEFREFFGTNQIDGRKMYQDEETSEERVCRRVPKVIYPQMAKNQAKQWVYVVNDVEYVQAVVSEVCEKEDKPCAYLDHNLPPGVYSRCRQKYAYRRLLAIHPTEKRTYTDTFQFPSCCACYIKSPGFGRSKERKRRDLPWL